ncbi:hypothetical protein FHL15_011110 [Xylaria flabelliformis]|uniref:Uncharacterized protein n=1 Tax=Xylaria flabelliformis TaxID=2512241 RepID=A0A553HJ75_9PEZI|nr:hypothetical protein FHL15_011110 [Xylaria flabelliformis]
MPIGILQPSNLLEASAPPATLFALNSPPMSATLPGYSGPRPAGNTTGTLNFTGQAYPLSISVADCPRLQVLQFPDAYVMSHFDKANDLTTVSLPSLPAALFAINGSLSISSSLLPAGDANGHPNEIAPRVITVGPDLNITSNTNVNLTFDALTSVGGLSVYNNTNGGFKFNKISTVGSMLLVDNVNTTLLWFPALTRANNIHKRGYIDTSVGPNIFPALQSVPGTVVIEAWNDDFNCSKSNNGTNNGTDATSSEPNQVLSQGAWGGIGVAIGIVVIGINYAADIKHEGCDARSRGDAANNPNTGSRWSGDHQREAR